VGRGRPGEAAAAVAQLHALHGRHRVRGGQRGRGADGGGARRTDAHGQDARERRRAHPGVRQQAGPAGRARPQGGGEAAGAGGGGHVAHAGLERRQRLRPPLPRAAGVRHHRRRSARGHGAALRDGPQKAQTLQAEQEAEQVRCQGVAPAVVFVVTPFSKKGPGGFLTVSFVQWRRSSFGLFPHTH
jgi:hypothetical protein